MRSCTHESACKILSDHAPCKDVSSMKSLHLIFLFLFFFVFPTYACTYIAGGIDHQYEKASAIYMGYVVGVHHEELDEEVIRQDFTFESKVRSIYPKSIYEIRVKETVKGPEKDNISFTHSSCSNGNLEIKERVIVYRFEKHDFAMLLDRDLYEQVKSHANNKLKNVNVSEAGSDALATRPF